MKKVLSLVPPFSKQALVEDSARALNRALEEEFTSVIIFGFKDDKVKTITSKSRDTLRVLGALEAAKRELWQA